MSADEIEISKTDYIEKVIGPERSNSVVAARSVNDKGINWTINTDYPAGVGPSPIGDVECGQQRQNCSQSALFAENAI